MAGELNVTNMWTTMYIAIKIIYTKNISHCIKRKKLKVNFKVAAEKLAELMGWAVVLVVKVHVFALFWTGAEDIVAVLTLIMSNLRVRTDFMEIVPVVVWTEVVVEVTAVVVASGVVDIVDVDMPVVPLPEETRCFQISFKSICILFIASVKFDKINILLLYVSVRHA